VLSVTNSVVGSVFQVFTVGLFAFYLVADGPQFRRSICSVLRPERQRVVLGLWELAIAKTGGYLYSRMLLAAVCSMTSWVVFTVLGISSPLALALWIGVVSQFIPVIGTYIGGLIPALVALLASPTTALIVLVFIIVYQQVENYFLSPKITARTMEIHPAVAFGSAIAGASIMGAAGALLALPAAAIIQAFVSSYLERHEVVDSSLTVVVGEATVVSEAVTPEAVSAVVSDQSRDAEKSGQSKPES
jgi:predicted PurR-regulated permease PerM